jgi:hypothetical protein
VKSQYGGTSNQAVVDQLFPSEGWLTVQVCFIILACMVILFLGLAYVFLWNLVGQKKKVGVQKMMQLSREALAQAGNNGGEDNEKDKDKDKDRGGPSSVSGGGDATATEFKVSTSAEPSPSFAVIPPPVAIVENNVVVVDDAQQKKDN